MTQGSTQHYPENSEIEQHGPHFRPMIFSVVRVVQSLSYQGSAVLTLVSSIL
jgi:hypothetical protein